MNILDDQVDNIINIPLDSVLIVDFQALLFTMIQTSELSLESSVLGFLPHN
jgi:hypothetical protein